MSSKLSSVLVQAGVVPVRKVEEAIQRQVIYGGSLGTNLLEMGAVDEETLRIQLGRATGLPPADYRWIRQPNPEALKVFPRKLSERYRMLPVAAQGNLLQVMVPESLERSVIEELSFMLGLEIRPYVMPEIRYMEALDVYFGFPLRPRYRNLLRKLDSGQAPAGAELRSYTEEQRIEQLERKQRGSGPATGVVQGLSPKVPLELVAVAAGVPEAALASTLGTPARVSPKAEAELRAAPVAAGVAAQPPGAAAAAAQPPGAAGAVASPPGQMMSDLFDAARTPVEPLLAGHGAPAPGGPASGPSLAAAPLPPATEPPPASAQVPPQVLHTSSTVLQPVTMTLAEASTLLDQQEQRDGLLAVAFSYLSGWLENIYSFIVKGDGIRAYLGLGAGIDRFEPLTEKTQELPASSLMGGVCRSRHHYLGPIDHCELAVSFYADLGREVPLEGLLLPVVLRERTVLLLLADNASRPIEPAALPETLVLVQRLAHGLERLIIQQKRQARSTMAESGKGNGVETERPVLAEAADPAAQRKLPVAPLGSPAPTSTPLLSPPPASASLPSPLPASASPALPGPGSAPPAASRGAEEPGAEPARPAGDTSLAEETPTEPVLPASPALAGPGALQPDVEGASATPPEVPRLVDRVTTPLVELAAPTDDGGAGTPVALPAAPIIELTRVVRRTAGEADPGQAEQPAAAEDPEQSLEQRTITELVAMLAVEDSRARAMAALRSLGIGSLEQLMRAFPGPVTVERDSLLPGRYPPVEDHGPLLALLVELGAAALPHLRKELESATIANRFYATLLVGRSGDKALLGVLAERLYDPVGLVRQAAREALTPFLRQEGFAAIRTRIASDILLGEGERVRQAAEAAAWFRSTEAVEPLIMLLKHRDPQQRDAALAALRKITLQDFGTSIRAWKRWLQKNEHRDRIEWLIESLVHEDAELREQAAQELHRTTGQRIRFDPTGPRREWKRAQNEWLAWYHNGE